MSKRDHAERLKRWKKKRDLDQRYPLIKSDIDRIVKNIERTFYPPFLNHINYKNPARRVPAQAGSRALIHYKNLSRGLLIPLKSP